MPTAKLAAKLIDYESMPKDMLESTLIKTENNDQNIKESNEKSYQSSCSDSSNNNCNDNTSKTKKVT